MCQDPAACLRQGACVRLPSRAPPTACMRVMAPKGHCSEIFFPRKHQSVWDVWLAENGMVWLCMRVVRLSVASRVTPYLQQARGLGCAPCAASAWIGMCSVCSKRVDWDVLRVQQARGLGCAPWLNRDGQGVPRGSDTHSEQQACAGAVTSVACCASL